MALVKKQLPKTRRSETFGSRLKAALEHRQITIRDLAKEADVSYEMARRYCADEGIPRHRARISKIASVLQVEAEWLLNGVGPGLGPKKYAFVPLFNLDEAELSWEPHKWKTKPSIPSPYSDFSGIAVKMPVPMGCQAECHGIKLFKQGDVLYVIPPQGQPAEHTVVVIERKKKAPGRRYYVRIVKYAQSPKNGIAPVMSFASADPERFCDLTTQDYKVFGVVDSVSAKLTMGRP